MLEDKGVAELQPALHRPPKAVDIKQLLGGLRKP